MKKQISDSTFFDKKVFPTLLFSFLTFIVVAIQLGSDETGPSTVGLITTITAFAMAFFGYVVMQVLYVELIDEVYDEGDALLFKNAGKEVRVFLQDIHNINSETTSTSTRRKVTLLLSQETDLGNKLTFYVRDNLLPNGRNTVMDIDELYSRINLARK